MVFCNSIIEAINCISLGGHNPYFNRWFSAMNMVCMNQFLSIRHNPYFNRWFSAIFDGNLKDFNLKSHNPYFNRWFSAIVTQIIAIFRKPTSQSLF